MPIFEYDCVPCGETVERYEALAGKDAPPKCGCGKRMKKIPSTSFAQFFGDGAYATYYGPQWRNLWGRGHLKENEGKSPATQENLNNLDRSREFKPADAAR